MISVFDLGLCRAGHGPGILAVCECAGEAAIDITLVADVTSKKQQVEVSDWARLLIRARARLAQTRKGGRRISDGKLMSRFLRWFGRKFLLVDFCVFGNRARRQVEFEQTNLLRVAT